MTQYVTADMDLEDIASLVLDEFKEPVTGSNAMPLDRVYDKINAAYFDIYNEAEDDSYMREGDYTFMTVADGKLDGALAAGDTTITLEDSSGFPNATRSVLIDNKDWAQYTTNDLATDLTGVTGIDVAHVDGKTVRLGYPISSITDMDEQEVGGIFIEGLLYEYQEPALWLNVTFADYRHFTIFEDNIYLPETSAAQIATMIYNKKVVPLTVTTAKPTLIPPKFREALLVSGGVMKLGARDEMRTGFDWHEARYHRELKKFYAWANNRVKSKGPRTRPSIYD